MVEVHKEYYQESSCNIKKRLDCTESDSSSKEGER